MVSACVRLLSAYHVVDADQKRLLEDTEVVVVVCTFHNGNQLCIDVVANHKETAYFSFQKRGMLLAVFTWGTCCNV